MTRQEILDRLELPQPIRQGEFALMSGYSAVTLRRLLRDGSFASVGLPGSRERRVPVEEARRLLTDLRVI